MASGNWVDRDELWNRREDKKWESFSWLTVRALLSSVNDVIGKGAPRLVNDLRGAWVDSQEDADGDGRWNAGLVIPQPDATSFLLLGDPGEQDFSQYVVVPVLVSQDDAAFMVVMSDVIYPSGDVNDYVDGFYIPYGALRMPIYALPGNHDWYDGLNGFMWNFCEAEPLPPGAYDTASYTPRERIARRIWRKASAPQRDRLNAHRTERVDPAEWKPLQPGPYFAIETDDLLIVCVDSGITGDIDRAQAEWLVRTSESTKKSKIMLVGRPLLDKKHHKPGPFPQVGGVPPVDATDGTAFASIDDVARHKPYGYIAAIGGDTHNYQRYDVTLRDKDGSERPFHYVVSGGGGAYMSATHIIDGANELHFDEDQNAARSAIRLERFESYPSAVDSLSYFAKLVVPRLFRLVLRVLLALIGVGVAAAAALLFDVDDDTLEIALIATAGLLGVGLLVAFFRPGERVRATKPSAARRAVTYIGSFLLGVAAGLAAWWLSPDHFGRHMIVFGSIVLVAGLIGQLLRKTGIWRTKWVSVSLMILQPLAGAAALGAFVLREADWVQVLVMFAAVLLVPLCVLVLVDRLRGWFPNHYKLILLAVLVVVVVLAVLFLNEEWARAVAAAAVIVALSLLTVVFAHLHFLNASSLLYRPDMRNGTLTPDEAQQVLDWRADSSARPSNARTRRIGNIVHPGSTNPQGPLHRFISEIFDQNEPPLYKNFLRVDVTADTVEITCFHATGMEVSPSEVTCEDPITINLPRPAPV
jgi:Calcineurin-like phosphoesterase